MFGRVLLACLLVHKRLIVEPFSRIEMHRRVLLISSVFCTKANRVSDAIKSGISIVACENTMTAQKINKDDMNASISYVPAGVIRLMKRQQEGWAYIRP